MCASARVDECDLRHLLHVELFVCQHMSSCVVTCVKGLWSLCVICARGRVRVCAGGEALRTMYQKSAQHSQSHSHRQRLWAGVHRSAARAPVQCVCRTQERAHTISAIPRRGVVGLECVRGVMMPGSRRGGVNTHYQREKRLCTPRSLFRFVSPLELPTLVRDPFGSPPVGSALGPSRCCSALRQRCALSTARRGPSR